MESHTGSHYQYVPYNQAISGPPSEYSSIHRLNTVVGEQDEFHSDLNGRSESTSYFRRKPIRFAVDNVETENVERIELISGEEAKRRRHKVKRRIYWATPLAAILLFFLGFGAAVGHYVYFTRLNGKSVGDQTWTLRYSLAIAFVFKSTLAASISLALAQHVWFTLRNSKPGTSVSAIDSMFLANSSLTSFLSPSLWRAAFTTGIMAACIWAMPLTALVAPTALTIGSSSVATIDDNCIVPTLDVSATRNFSDSTNARSLFADDYTDTYFSPSISSERLTAAVLTNGYQLGWQSPCGPTCTYEIQFTGPSWQCTQTEDVDDPRAPWKPEFQGSYWYWGEYGDGSNITVTQNNSDYLNYSPVYYAGLNASTNQFWTGFATGFLRGLDPSVGLLNHSLREILDVQVYYCQVVNTSYNMHVDFTNGVQTNTLNHTKQLSIFSIAPEGWNGQGHYSLPDQEYEQTVPVVLQDIVGMYLPMIGMLSGYIRRDPRQELVSNTSLGLVQTVITSLPLNVTYGSETPYLPLVDFGSVLQQLSYNLTISLLHDPTLLVTTTTTTTCYKTQLESVWEFNWLPIVVAYAAGLGATLICLAIGTYALVANGVAHDMSFSSVVRATRNEDLNGLCDPNDVAALPLSSFAKKQRLRFLDGRPFDVAAEDTARVRRGFVLER